MGKISYSQLSMYNDCPLRWKLNYVDKLSVSDTSPFLKVITSLFGFVMVPEIVAFLTVSYELLHAAKSEIVKAIMASFLMINWFSS